MAIRMQYYFNLIRIRSKDWVCDRQAAQDFGGEGNDLLGVDITLVDGPQGGGLGVSLYRPLPGRIIL